ncbi:MAG: ABC transporter ATP-binding protein [Oscillibacter sp.]|nr:ABC transporter ATP-binding protein [Oscillibacter sp.]
MSAVISGKEVTQRFGGLVAVNRVNFHLDKNEIVGIIGPNGAGKSTLFNCITGVYPPAEGQIYFRDLEITGKRPHEITKLGMARTFQNIRLFQDMTVLENAMVGAHARLNSTIVDAIFRLPRHRSSEQKALEKAEAVLDITGLSRYRCHYATSLPYGLQRRLEIARAMASDPEVLLFDEPAAGMNEQETNDLMDLIRQLKEMGFTILLIEHDMRLVMNVCERLYVLDHGNLIASGYPEEIRKNPQVIEAYLGKEA